MKINWLGHSCFLLAGKGKTVVTDPYSPGLGYSLGHPEADIVTLSHFHPGHSNVRDITGSPKEVKCPGEYDIGGVFITGIASFHDDQQGKLRGKNTIYLIEIDGLSLCHLGDLGHPLTPQMAEQLRVVDILFLPVGEVSTISVSTAAEIVKQLEPRIVIPMHYKTSVLLRDLEEPDKFFSKMGGVEINKENVLSVTSSSLPANMQFVVFDYPAD
jgi:L-ascorbate metabolism protein UlaG (beta-lactamase superfamily)